MKVFLLLIILTIGLVGCHPAVEIYEEANEMVLNEETLNELDASEKAILNAQLKMYEGRMRGTEVKNFINKLNTYNANGVFPTTLIINDYSNSNIVLVEGEYLSDGIKDASNYEISLEYGEDGVITAVNINVNN